MTQTKQNLIAAKALISDPEHWTQGVFARGVDNREINYESADAACYCVVGAILRVTGKSELFFDGLAEFQCLARAATELFELDPVEVNDQRTHRSVMRMFDLAIAKVS